MASPEGDFRTADLTEDQSMGDRSPAAPHPELGSEQAFVDRAYELLDKGLADAERSMADHSTLHRSTALAMQRALRILQQSRGSGQLVFGKMVAGDGDEMYVGRRRVRDEEFNPVVVGWHAPAAQPFYEASPSQPGDVTLKRIFSEEERRLVRVIDEIVAATAAAATDPSDLGVSFSDALLEELDRSRDGAMRDVVATIQSEQFGIIRAPLDRVVVVAGGPGTGKTVVGLHRAAWLAFNHEELRRSGILVVAPSTTFLTYVSGVLPSLDVTDVDQVELQRLYAGEAEVSGRDDADTARVKGSEAMAELLARALSQRVGWPEEDLVLGLGADRIRLPAADVQQMVEAVRARGLSHIDGRNQVRERLAAMAYDVHREAQRESGRPVRANEATIRRLAAFGNALDRMWPTFTPEEFLRSLYSTQAWLTRAAEGVLTSDERARLYRPGQASVAGEPWTEGDLFCLDEVSSLLTRDNVTYGHLVVDEAQDLSAMQARALARRCPSGSVTLLGDLAQGTTHWVRDDWIDLTRHLAASEPEVHPLSIGYRVPSEVLGLAERQLPLAGPGLAAPRSIRPGLGAPVVVAVSDDEASSQVASVARESVEAERSVAVLVADAVYDEWLARMEGEGVRAGDGRDGDFASRVTLVPRSASKGLEFDVVVLVEPAQLAAESLHPARALYVAMTRCTQQLVVVHSSPLPAGFPSDGVAERQVDGLPAPHETAADHADVAETMSARIARLLPHLADDDRDLVLRLVERLVRHDGEDW